MQESLALAVVRLGFREQPSYAVIGAKASVVASIEVPYLEAVEMDTIQVIRLHRVRDQNIAYAEQEILRQLNPRLSGISVLDHKTSLGVLRGFGGAEKMQDGVAAYLAPLPLKDGVHVVVMPLDTANTSGIEQVLEALRRSPDA